MILLTPRELEKLQEYQEPNNKSIGYEKNIAKAQSRKIVEWLEEPCGKHIIKDNPRRCCTECWSELIKEIE